MIKFMTVSTQDKGKKYDRRQASGVNGRVTVGAVGAVGVVGAIRSVK